MFTLNKTQLTGPLGKVRLTGAEATLLREFQLSPHARLSYAQIATCLGLQEDGDLRAVMQVRLVRLRKKIQSTGAQGAVIESIRNVGYQFFESLQIET